MENAIKANFQYLAENLTNLDSVLTHLMQKGILFQIEQEKILAEETSFCRNYKLLSLLQRKNGSYIIDQFCRILWGTGNGHCANEIERSLKIEAGANLNYKTVSIVGSSVVVDDAADVTHGEMDSVKKRKILDAAHEDSEKNNEPLSLFFSKDQYDKAVEAAQKIYKNAFNESVEYFIHSYNYALCLHKANRLKEATNQFRSLMKMLNSLDPGTLAICEHNLHFELLDKIFPNVYAVALWAQEQKWIDMIKYLQRINIRGSEFTIPLSLIANVSDVKLTNTKIILDGLGCFNAASTSRLTIKNTIFVDNAGKKIGSVNFDSILKPEIQNDAILAELIIHCTRVSSQIAIDVFKLPKSIQKLYLFSMATILPDLRPVLPFQRFVKYLIGIHSRLPKSLGRFSNLIEIHIKQSKHEQPMQLNLGTISSNIQILSLEGLTFLDQIYCRFSGMPKLKKLILKKCPGIDLMSILSTVASIQLLAVTFTDPIKLAREYFLPLFFKEELFAKINQKVEYFAFSDLDSPRNKDLDVLLSALSIKDHSDYWLFSDRKTKKITKLEFDNYCMLPPNIKFPDLFNKTLK